MKDQIRQKLQLSHLSRLCRRAVALTLALAMVLPTAAFGAGPEIEPGIRVPHALEPGEEPTITVEANAVVNRWYDKAMGDPSEYLTGDLEVAIRVQSGQIGGVWQPFNTLSVALDYSPILTPYKWTLIDGIDLSGEDLSHLTPEQRVAYKTGAPNVTEVDLVNNVTNQFDEMTSMQTLKSKQITTAVAHVSGQMEKDGEGNVTAVKDGHLYMMAQADRPVVLEKDTVLAVVTFKYDVENIKILASQAPDWFQWLVGTGTSTAAEGDGGDGTTGDGTGDGTTGDTIGGVAPEDKWLVKVTDITPTNESYFAREIHYDSQDNSMYYSVDRKGLYAGLDTSVAPPVEVYVDNYIELNHKVNDVEAHQVNFTLVNQTTYNDGGLTLDDLATVLFYDWDDTLIGVLTVPKDGDARKLVNDYVCNNMVHPSLKAADIKSVERKNNYRGNYPATEPMPKGNVDTTVVTNGEDFALTNKLDYVFLKRPMEQDPDDANKWVQTTDASGGEAIWDEQYPYIHGWALIPDKDLSDNKYTHPKTIWTTLGVGELSNYSGIDGAKKVIPGTLICEDENFKFANFDFRGNNSLKKSGSVYAVKAVYEPGDELQSGFAYTIVGEPTMRRYTYTASTTSGGATYAVEYQYERTVVDSRGLLCGVSRTRDPVVRVEYEPDLAGRGIKKGDFDPFYMELEVENKDIIDVKLTPAAAIVSMDYVLIDRYGLNFMVGGRRSSLGDNREMIVKDNVDYDHFTFDIRLGSDGFVYDSTILTLLEEGIKAAKKPVAESNRLSEHWTQDTLRDINIRKNKAGDSFGPLEVASSRTTFVNMIVEAKNQGYTDEAIMNLTWHQIQYYYLNRKLVDKDTAQAEKFLWCRRNDGCVDAAVTIVTDLETLMKAAYEAANGSYDSLSTLLALDLVNKSPMYLRSNAEGEPFDDLEAFKREIIEVARNAGTPDLTWAQVQYALLHGNQLATGGEDTYAFQEEYWWYDGGEKVVDWDSFLSAISAAAISGRNAVVNTAKGENMPSITHGLASSAIHGTDGDTYISATPYTEADFTQLCSDLRAAMVQAGLKYIQNPTWDQIQYYLLEGEFNTEIDMNAHGAKYYWWYDNGTLVEDVPSLLIAVANAKNGRTAALDQLTAEQISGDPLYLRQDFTGKPYENTEENLTFFKNTLNGLPSIVTSWASLQYYLIHKSYTAADASAASAESMSYYWWKDGGTATAPSILAGNINTLVNAAFLATYNGNDQAWGKLTTAIIKNMNFRNPTAADAATIGKFADLPLYGDGDIATFTGRMEALVKEALKDSTHPHSAPVLSWYQIQEYLITEVYDATPDETVLASTYWWKEGGNNPNVSVKTDFEILLEYMAAYKASGDTTGIDGLTSAFLTGKDMEFRPTKTSKPGAAFNSLQLKNTKKYLKMVADAVSDVTTLTWANIQYAILNKGAYGTDSYAWDPTVTTFMMMRMPLYQSQFSDISTGITDVEVDEEANTTTVTTTVETQLGENTLTVETVVVIDLLTGKTVTTTTTTLTDAEGNVLSTTESVVEGEEYPVTPEEPAESPVPTESETPSPSESEGPDVPIGPETSPEPTESPDPEATPSPEPSESPADPEPTPSEPPEELPDPETPKTEQPTPEPTATASPSKGEETDETTDPASPSGGGGTGEAGDGEGGNGADKTTDPASPSGGGGAGGAGDGEGQETDSSQNEVSLTTTPPKNLSTTALTRSLSVRSETRIANRLQGSANGGGRLRRPTQPKLIGLPQGLLTRWTPDRFNILTIGRTQA